MDINRAEIEKFLKNWATAESKPHFAVLIEGCWGCGKTHFVKKLLEDDGFTKRKRIYLSVFGIPDIQSLEKSLFYASASKAKKMFHKGVGFAGSIFSGSIMMSSGGFFGGTANLNKVAGVAIKQLEKSAENMDGALLVLDDMERCQIPMSELLGFVNRFVEHGDTRVVLCGNTDGLNDDHFRAFKEKVVGHSFLLESDPNSAFDSFMAEIRKSKASDLLSDYKKDILELYDKAGYHNLRALRQFLWHLVSILEEMKEAYRQNDRLVQNLIIQFFIFFVEFKLDLDKDSVSLKPSDLLGEYDKGKDKVRYVYEPSPIEDKEPTQRRRVLDKYELDRGISTAITVQQWISILTSGVIDKERLNAELAQSFEVVGVSSWRRLYSLDYSDGSDQEFRSDVEDMQSKLKDGKYIEVGEFFQVVGISLMLADKKLIEQTVPDTVSQMKRYIVDHFIPKLTDEYYRSFSESYDLCLFSYDGLDFIGRKSNEFGEISDYLKSKIKAGCETWLEQEAGKLPLGLFTEDWGHFFGNMTIVNIPILAKVDVVRFVDNWFSLSPYDERNVAYKMKFRYKYRPELWEAEEPWWREVQNELKLRMDSSESKLRSAQIENLIDKIDSSIAENWKQRQSEKAKKDNSSDAELDESKTGS